MIALLAFSLLGAIDTTDFKKNGPEARAAWDKIVSQGPKALPEILDAMDARDNALNNWLRTAFDRIADNASDPKSIDIDAILTRVKDPKKPGPARRLGLDLVEKLRPNTSSKLFADWLEDPEFRYEAVAQQLKKAMAINAVPQSTLEYQKAFDASRDQTQAREAAARLGDMGVKVSVGDHLGFFRDWHLIGPFDAQGKQGYKLSYPPEKKVDLKAEYDGKSGKVRWVHVVTPEPSNKSGTKHQALINLREKNALGDAEDAVAFAYTEFTLDADQKAEFRGAADDGFVVYVNGQKLFLLEEYENGVRLDRHRFTANLKKGLNTVLVKIVQGPPPTAATNWEFLLRVVDETGKGIRKR